jgi:cysteate synthase
MFEEVEGIEIEPAAGVAVAALAVMVESGEVAHDEIVLLNVTGGGRGRRSSEMQLESATPDLWVDAADVEERSKLDTTAEIVAKAVQLSFSK